MKKFPCKPSKRRRAQRESKGQQQTHEAEPRKYQVERLIEQLDVYPELARKRVRRPVYVVELDRAVYGGEERAVEPSPALRDQLWDLQRVRVSVGWDTQSAPDPGYR
jgi:hypothetical protein